MRNIFTPSRPRLLALALAAFPMACSASTAEIASAHRCEIRALPTADGVRIESIVYGRPGDAGRYEMSLVRSAAGGQSDVRQAGDYVIPPSGTAVVSVSDFNHQGRDRLDMVLTVSDSGGADRCEAHW